MRTVTPAALALTLLLTTVGVPAAVAGGECASSRLANELMDCSHCNRMKAFLMEDAIGGVTMQVHELDAGAIVEIEGTDAASVALAQKLVAEIWATEGACETPLASACTARYAHLERCEIEATLTPTGALVVLRGEAEEDVDWLREDARGTRSFILAAVSVFN